MTFPLMPPPVSITVPVVTFTYAEIRSANQSSYNFTATSIGVAAADRYILVSVQSIGNIVNVTSVTIGGVATTMLYGGQSGFWLLLVPTGATADIVVNFDGTASRIALGVWRAVGLSRPAHVNSVYIDGTAASLNANIITSHGGTIVATVSHNSTSPVAWSGANMVEKFDANTESVTFSGAQGKPTTAGSQTITVTGTGSGYMRIVAVQLR